MENRNNAININSTAVSAKIVKKGFLGMTKAYFTVYKEIALRGILALCVGFGFFAIGAAFIMVGTVSWVAPILFILGAVLIIAELFDQKHYFVWNKKEAIERWIFRKEQKAKKAQSEVAKAKKDQANLNSLK